MLAAAGPALVSAAAPPATAAGEASGELDRLMQLLSQRRHGQVDFVEQHFLHVLERPVESFGVMTYDAPQRLEKRTLEPRPERLLVDGDRVTIERRGHTHVLELSAYPSLEPFIEGLRATLGGDLPALEHHFTLDFEGSLLRWTLTLTPRDASVRKTVSAVRIDGARDVLRRVEMDGSEGDRSVMTLRDRPMP